MQISEYTREQITAGAAGRLPEDGGEFDFMLNLLPRPDDDRVDFHKVWNDHLERLARLSDFSRGDEAARRQLDKPVPGWSAQTDRSRLARALQVQDGTPLPSRREIRRLPR